MKNLKSKRNGQKPKRCEIGEFRKEKLKKWRLNYKDHRRGYIWLLVRSTKERQKNNQENENKV